MLERALIGYFFYLLRYLRALPTIGVHPELDGRMLDIVHCLSTRKLRLHVHVC